MALTWIKRGGHLVGFPDPRNPANRYAVKALLYNQWCVAYFEGGQCRWSEIARSRAEGKAMCEQHAAGGR